MSFNFTKMTKMENAEDFLEMTMTEKSTKAIRDVQYDSTMLQLKSAGIKALIEIPVDTLILDTTYQTEIRISSKRRQKNIMKLSRDWNENKLEPITVIPHTEKKRFSIINGCGRLLSSQMQIPAYENLWATVLLGAKDYDPITRRKFESELFAYQGENITSLRAIEKEGALINIEDEAALILKNTQRIFNFNYKDGNGRRDNGILGSYDEVYRIAKNQGEECLNYIFTICKKAGFDRKSDGYSSYIIKSLKDIWVLYPDSREETKIYISSMFRPLTPTVFKSNAVTRYPVPEARTACSLYLEDKIVEDMSYDKKREFINGKIIKIPG